MQDGKFIASVRWGVVLNIGQKLLSFGLNQALVRCTTPEVLGLAAVQLELLLSSLTFLSREGIRLALLRETMATGAERQRFVNLSWVPVATLTVITAALLCLAAYNQSFSNTASLMYCLGAVLEAAGEPWVNLLQNNGQIVPKMQAEAGAVFVKSVVTFVAVTRLGWGVDAFGLAQIMYGLTYLVLLSSHTSAIMVQQQPIGFLQLLPGRPPGEPGDGDDCSWFGARPVAFAFTATGSCILKHVLTEADKIFLSLFRSNYDQGIFAVANNYASLVVRILFLPIEDSARVAFSKKLHQAAAVENGAPGQQLLLLVQLLRVVGLIGLLFPLFGTSFVHLAVRFLFGVKWQGIEIERTLMAFCLYIFAMSINGVSEAYCQVLASSADFYKVNIGLILGFLVYSAVSFVLIDRVGTSGIVLAGSASMLVRITCSYLIARANNKTIPIMNAFLPSMMQVLTVVLGAVLCYLSSRRFVAAEQAGEIHRGALEHLLIGVATALFLLALHWRELLQRLSALSLVKTIKNV